MSVCRPNPHDRANRHGRRETLSGNRLLLDAPHDVHAFDDPAKGGEALAVLVPAAAEIERRLVVEADEKIRRRGIGGNSSLRRSGLMPAWMICIGGRSGSDGV